MNAYEWKQTAFGAAVDRGLYSLASRIDEVNAAEFSGGIPWYIISAIANGQQRLTPERSTETGDKRTLTPRRKCGIIKAIRRCIRRVKRNQEGKKMKGYFYKTNGYEGILITNGKKWISFTDSEKIDGLYCEEQNAKQIGENFKSGIADGGFDDYEFNDWYENTGAGTRHTSGTGVKRFLETCERYYQIF